MIVLLHNEYHIDDFTVNPIILWPCMSKILNPMYIINILFSSFITAQPPKISD